jgi:hypothetical protein
MTDPDQVRTKFDSTSPTKPQRRRRGITEPTPEGVGQRLRQTEPRRGDIIFCSICLPSSKPYAAPTGLAFLSPFSHPSRGGLSNSAPTALRPRGFGCMRQHTHTPRFGIRLPGEPNITCVDPNLMSPLRGSPALYDFPTPPGVGSIIPHLRRCDLEGLLVSKRRSTYSLC